MDNKAMDNIPIKTTPYSEPMQNDFDDIPKEDLPNRIIPAEDSAEEDSNKE